MKDDGLDKVTQNENSGLNSLQVGAGAVLLVTLLFLGVTIFSTYYEGVIDMSDLPAVDSNIEMTTTASGLQYQDKVVGDGAEALPGQNVTVHYTGWLTDGSKFDSSVDRGTPFDFPLGGGRVIKGWDEGVAGMKVGGIRVLVIPSDLGYGDSGAGASIPPGATLVFQVELLDVK